MQLKKIIIKGFKSFPEKTTLEFNEGVTAIVGPNGSGKSNIIEAIRWVMGEQSAKTLRGDRMNDVIFSGTNERKPLNIAEVEIILDNSDGYLEIDFEEVSVLRRITRSGDSVYMINQQECRLKDIVNLFMDSGLGKESFSIISQGQVEAIFNSKPEDRRGIFEEAAGVFKYKVRKKDAEKKLDETQENLDRVQDIIYELEAQLKPLRKQADVARSYLEQREKLTDLDIGVSVWQIKDLLQKIDADNKQVSNLSGQIESINAQITELESKEIDQQKELNKLEETRESLSIKLISIVQEKERTKSALDLFDEKARHQEVFIREKEETIFQINERLKKAESNLENVNQNFAEKNAALTNISQKIKEIEKEREYLEGDRETQIAELRSLYIELLQKQTSLKNELNYLEQELTKSQYSKEKKLSDEMALKDELDNVLNDFKAKEVGYNQVSADLLDLLNEYKVLEKNISEKKENIRVQSERVVKTSNELERAKAKQNSLLEMQENYAGYYAGVRSIMKNQNKLDGIVGTVAELLHVSNQYVIAIDTVLSSSGQFIVVEDEKSARDAINYLKQSKSGRATFLPLTTIKPRFIMESVKNKISQLPGYIGIASELVSYDEKVETIFHNLLGQTIIAETLTAANQIARAIDFKNRVVSLDGDVINAGGSMTGGGSRKSNTSPIFTQKKELDVLAKFISENGKVVEQLVKNQEAVEIELSDLETTAQTIRTQGESKRLEEQKVHGEMENLNVQISRLERELKVTSFELNENNDDIEKQNVQMQTTLESLKQVQSDVEDSKQRMELLSSEQENIEAEKIKVAEKLNEVFEVRNDIREELASVRTNRQGLEEQIDQFHEQIQNIEEDIKAFDEKSEVESKEELELSYNELKAIQEKIEAEQLANKENIANLNIILREYKNEMSILTGKNKYFADEKAKLEVQLSKNDVRLDHNLNYLVDEYKIGFEEAKLLDEPELPIEEAQKQVRLLKKGIEELGPVNLNAISEYEGVHERYSFLSEQQNDLIEAKANLYNTMDEMDAIVEKQFKETFDKIQIQFSSVFPKMFGGGYAELVLSEPNNILETGIEIIAQPPGKRLTRLSLLSGGERALTAISLLFAIIQVNPIPFCILDEAEAALDDANVDRFGRYLEEFEFDTQFIVITHRKGTMEHADQLYGVTMQEKGISKIVSVSLSEAQAYDGVS